MSQAFKGQRFVFRQPDDSEIEVVGWGNQFEAVFETIDGYTVVVNPATGFYEYATLSADGTTLLPSGTVVTAQSTFTGNPAHVRTTAMRSGCEREPRTTATARCAGGSSGSSSATPASPHPTRGGHQRLLRRRRLAA